MVLQEGWHYNVISLTRGENESLRQETQVENPHIMLLVTNFG